MNVRAADFGKVGQLDRRYPFVMISLILHQYYANYSKSEGVGTFAGRDVKIATMLSDKVLAQIQTETHVLAAFDWFLRQMIGYYGITDKERSVDLFQSNAEVCTKMFTNAGRTLLGKGHALDEQERQAGALGQTVGAKERDDLSKKELDKLLGGIEHIFRKDLVKAKIFTEDNDSDHKLPDPPRYKHEPSSKEREQEEKKKKNMNDEAPSQTLTEVAFVERKLEEEVSTDGTDVRNVQIAQADVNHRLGIKTDAEFPIPIIIRPAAGEVKGRILEFCEASDVLGVGGVRTKAETTKVKKEKKDDEKGDVDEPVQESPQKKRRTEHLMSVKTNELPSEDEMQTFQKHLQAAGYKGELQFFFDPEWARVRIKYEEDKEDGSKTTQTFDLSIHTDELRGVPQGSQPNTTQTVADLSQMLEKDSLQDHTLVPHNKALDAAEAVANYLLRGCSVMTIKACTKLKVLRFSRESPWAWQARAQAKFKKGELVLIPSEKLVRQGTEDAIRQGKEKKKVHASLVFSAPATVQLDVDNPEDTTIQFSCFSPLLRKEVDSTTGKPRPPDPFWAVVSCCVENAKHVNMAKK